jgi:hypothetical protein
MVLLTASLDVLANYWHVTADRKETPVKLSGAERMRRFLTRHGAHQAFERVSAPMFRNETAREIGSFPFARYRPGQMNEVADWNDDPKFTDLEGLEDAKALTRWSYGGILYKDFRCAWVHKFASDNEEIYVAQEDHLGRVEPYYRYVANRGYFLLFMPIAFLSGTLERAIRSFEEEATVRNIRSFVE